MDVPRRVGHDDGELAEDAHVEVPQVALDPLGREQDGRLVRPHHHLVCLVLDFRAQNGGQVGAGVARGRVRVFTEQVGRVFGREAGRGVPFRDGSFVVDLVVDVPGRQRRRNLRRCPDYTVNRILLFASLLLVIQIQCIPYLSNQTYI